MEIKIKNQNTNDTLKYLKNVRLLSYSLNENVFLLSGERNEYERKHFMFNKNSEDLTITEKFYEFLNHLNFAPELKSYKEFETEYQMFSMGKWETKDNYLVLYGSYTPVVHGLATYHLASFSKKGKFINEVKLFAYSLVDGKVEVNFDRKNTISVKVIISKDNENMAENTNLKITLNPKGVLVAKKSKK